MSDETGDGGFVREIEEPIEEFVQKYLERAGDECCWNCEHFWGMELDKVTTRGVLDDGEIISNSHLAFIGWCRRFPPVLCLTGGPNEYSGDGPGDWSQPCVRYDDYCGEFEAANRKASDFL